MEQQGPFIWHRERRLDSTGQSRSTERFLPAERRVQYLELLQEPDDFDGTVFGGYDLWNALSHGEQYVAWISEALRGAAADMFTTVDAETKAEFEEISSKSPLTGGNGAANQIQNFDLASWMAGKPAEAAPSGGGKKK